ncbi:uncharacterized protein LOC127379198 isoform X12 [Dicentrarchus labrax]|uniref:uncharacterized protein LOC127379198 isoform X10 n=1 Tax=Dicentrarchus labrax TaxID=13489 RepID=UPI0021F58A7D|nr:uncharacterized protein LOC127379198 isoform X10 [Dicentrarchus labrax]XP_051284474.1 uncharacterized protein LOC127379198 isoform X11 [Dicentrarchus labrax]XP_051284475.1 uncharacterized protein LOC127379198 isoform X12 [Dicentrarchus labrax]
MLRSHLSYPSVYPAAMAAAALSRSRGVAGVTATRGLFFIFSLLCLVCLASSFIDEDQLEKLKENVQKAEQQLESLKEKYKLEMASSLELINEYMGYLDPMIALVKKATGTSPDDFPPVDALLQSVKANMEKTKSYVEDQKVKLGAELENLEKDLEKQKKLIKFLEEQQGEL